MECFICLEPNNCTEKMQCCKQYAHKSCMLKWKMNHNKKHLLKCPCCREIIINDIFIPLELYNLPISFYKPAYKFAAESESESESESDSKDEYDAEEHDEYSFYVLKNKKTKK